MQPNQRGNNNKYAVGNIICIILSIITQGLGMWQIKCVNVTHVARLMTIDKSQRILSTAIFLLLSPQLSAF